MLPLLVMLTLDLSLGTAKSQPVFLNIGRDFVCASSKSSVPLCFLSCSLLSSSLVCICRLEAIGNRNSNRTSHLKAVAFIFHLSGMLQTWIICGFIALLVYFMCGRGRFWGRFKIRPLSLSSIWIHICCIIFLLFAGTPKGKVNSK